MKEKISKILLSIIVFIAYYYFFDIMSFILNIFKIEITSLSKLWFNVIIYLSDIIPITLLILLYRKDLKKDLMNFKNNTIPNIDKYLGLWCIGLIIMSITNILISLITGSDTSTNEQAIQDLLKIAPIYVTISSCIIAPIGEELAFRKCIRNMANDNKKIAIILSGILFGLAHVLGTYETLIDFLYVIPYGALGAVFMYMYIDSDSIFTTMTAHFIHNTILTIITFI